MSHGVYPLKAIEVEDMVVVKKKKKEKEEDYDIGQELRHQWNKATRGERTKRAFTPVATIAACRPEDYLYTRMKRTRCNDHVNP